MTVNSILITGGTGSFGQAFTKRLLEDTWFDRIIIYSRDEQKQEQMARNFNDDRLRFFIGDVRDLARLEIACRDVNYIIHAAALKIVPTGEYNPFEFVKTNIIGTQNVVECAAKHHIYKMFLLSTDKAVNPINLYGSTKLCAEKIVLAANNMYGLQGPKFSVVRYGNVVGSRGSVIPLFQKYARANLALPITDEKMTRFWITLPEAVEFVYNKLNSANGGETFIPDMPSFRIMELAKCFSNKYDIIGIRPGEKLHEEIEPGRSSNKNDRWLNIFDLEKKLMDMGYLG